MCDVSDAARRSCDSINAVAALFVPRATRLISFSLVPSFWSITRILFFWVFLFLLTTCILNSWDENGPWKCSNGPQKQNHGFGLVSLFQLAFQANVLHKLLVPAPASERVLFYYVLEFSSTAVLFKKYSILIKYLHSNILFLYKIQNK